jgi:pSer/pThr/pTyr-binding forkhead associated (FHA) protein
MKVKLVSIDPFSPVLEFEIPRLPAVLGREGSADSRLFDRGVCPRHCEILEQEGRLIVRDLDSKIGTLVNGKRAGFTELSPGDILTIGIRLLKVSFRSSRSAGGSKVEAATVSAAR